MKGFSQSNHRQQWLPWLVTCLLVILVSILGILQFRWLQQVADANRSQSRAALRTAVGRFASDFNQQLMGLLVITRGGRLSRNAEDLPTAVIGALQRWQETTDLPELVTEAWLIDPEGVRRLGLQDGTVETKAALPDSLSAPLTPWLDRLADHRRKGRHPASWPDVMVAELPGLVVPLFNAGNAVPVPHAESNEATEAAPAAKRSAGRENRQIARRRQRPQEHSAHLREHRRWHDRLSGSRRGRGDNHPNGLLVIPLDRQILIQQWLPSLAERHFGDSLPYRLTITPRDGNDLTPPVFTWGPEPTRGAVTEAQADLFGFFHPQEGRSRLTRFLPWLSNESNTGQWQLSAFHPEGSLDRALERSRRQSSAMALGILAILAGALVLLTRNNARAQRLANQQLDFVAGITHEIMTPVSSLRAAGQNLADGVVHDQQQVARYGRMIDREAGRLGDLVSQVLAFARMQSHRPRPALEAIDPSQVVDTAIEQSRSQLEAHNIELETQLDDEPLPRALCDRQTLTGALHNLIVNAIKYGQDPDRRNARGWIGLRCRAEAKWVHFEVEDRGDGIPADERGQIFQPFFRGAEHAAGAVPGSGLGLALVHHWITAQGGKVAVVSKVGPGSTFTISLPIAAAEFDSEGT